MKTGRPPKSAPREAMTTITFRVSQEAREALTQLEAALPAGTVGKRSVILRGLILAEIEKNRKTS